MPNQGAELTDREWDFLAAEYATSIDLIKYYDDRQVDLLKFASGISAGVPTVVFAFYGLSDVVATYVWDFAVFIAAITAISLSAIFAAMVRNRIYFVFPARQANVIRKRLFKESDAIGADEFKNQMYSTRNVPMIDLFSTQVLQLLFVALQSALFVAVCNFALHRSSMSLLSIKADLRAGGLWLVLLAFASALYVGQRSSMKANEILPGGRVG